MKTGCLYWYLEQYTKFLFLIVIYIKNMIYRDGNPGFNSLFDNAPLQ